MIVIKIFLVAVLCVLANMFILPNIKIKAYPDNWIAKHILFKGYYTIMLFGFVLSKNKKINETITRHETIHAYQLVELALLFFFTHLVRLVFGDISFSVFLVSIPLSLCSFYIIYFLYWAVLLVVYLFKYKWSFKTASKRAYKNILFEKEAYSEQESIGYLQERDIFDVIRYI